MSPIELFWTANKKILNHSSFKGTLNKVKGPCDGKARTYSLTNGHIPANLRSSLLYRYGDVKNYILNCAFLISFASIKSIREQGDAKRKISNVDNFQSLNWNLASRKQALRNN